MYPFLTKNLNYLLDLHKTNPNKLSKTIPVSQSTLSRIRNESNKKPYTPEYESIIEIAKWAGVQPNDLTDKDLSDIEKNRYEKSNATLTNIEIDVYEDGDPIPDGYIAIDYYDDVYVSGGNGYLNLQKPSAKKMLFPIDLVKDCNVQPLTTKVIHVRGESMFPKLKDGQAISVDMSATTIYDGEIYAFQVGEDTKIKYLSNWNDEGKGGFKAVSANPDKMQYPDEYYSPKRIESEGVFIIGQYWWKQTVKRIRR